MCDYFWQRTEGSRGDLADIVESGSRAGPTPSTDAVTAAAGWQQLPPPHPAAGNPSAAQEFCEREMVGIGPCSDDLLRVLQISPPGGGSSPSPLTPRPSADIAAVDHGGGVQQISSPRSMGIKRRKSQAKRVVCIPAPVAASGRQSTGEVVPSDLWAWRKYGQKPIKGSPYPRGYYRCSSSKGCPARKQVERSRTDPNMLVITYTSEHSHPWPTQRNSLAGSMRSHMVSKNSASARIKTASTAAAAAEEEEEEVEEEVASESTQQKGKVTPPAAAEKEELLDQILHYRPPTTSVVPDHDFFAGLAELESDPVSLIFSKGEELGGGLHKPPAPVVDPFAMFDWGAPS